MDDAFVLGDDDYPVEFRDDELQVQVAATVADVEPAAKRVKVDLKDHTNIVNPKTMDYSKWQRQSVPSDYLQRMDVLSFMQVKKLFHKYFLVSLMEYSNHVSG